MNRRHTESLYLIAERLAQSSVPILTRIAGAGDVFRLIVLYHDGRHPDQCATIVLRRGGVVDATVTYRTRTATPLLLRPTIPIERVRALGVALRTAHFDSLDDMPDLPYSGTDLWLIGRGVNTFYHDLVVAPDSAQGDYATLVAAIRAHWREAIRPI